MSHDAPPNIEDAPAALSAAAILDVWDEARARSPTRRALAVLGRAVADRDHAALAALTIGARDRLLLKLRAAQFGRELECVADCPDCGETLEFAVPIEDLLTPAPDADAHTRITFDGRELIVRAATSFDLVAVEALGEADGILALLNRCARPAEAGGVPGEAQEAVAAAMADLDPAADLRFSLNCPACGATWDSVLDIAGYLWTEIDMEARRLLPDIHAIASAYGWSEAAILALSPARRSGYLALIGAR